MSEALLAAPRDASFWVNPSRHGGMLHVIVGDRPACGVHAILQFDHAEPARDVESELRCRRNGCRQAFVLSEGRA